MVRRDTPMGTTNRTADTRVMRARDFLRSNLATLVLGGAALVAGTLAGWSDAIREAVVAPPLPFRLLLAAAAVLVGVALLLRAVDRLGESEDPAVLVRGVRLVFLAIAAFAASAGWAAAHPLPIIVALVIAGVDVVETTFLLIVVAVRDRG